MTEERWDLDLLRRAGGYQRWILATFGDAVRGDVLEVGAGTGNFTRWIAPEASSVIAVEPDASNVGAIRRLGLEHVEILQRPLESLAGDARRFDTVTMINVLEHIADDAGAVGVAAALLKPGGSLCMLAPAHPALMSRLDRNYGHVRRYRAAEMRRLLAQAGLTVRTCRYFNAIGAIGWLAFMRLGRARRLSPASVTLTERVAVPLGRLLERGVSPPFGQSVLAVATSPG